MSITAIVQKKGLSILRGLSCLYETEVPETFNETNAHLERDQRSFAPFSTV